MTRYYNQTNLMCHIKKHPGLSEYIQGAYSVSIEIGTSHSFVLKWRLWIAIVTV